MNDSQSTVGARFLRGFAKFFLAAFAYSTMVLIVLGLIIYRSNHSPEVLQAQKDLLRLHAQLKLDMPLESVLGLDLPEGFSLQDRTKDGSGEVAIQTPDLWTAMNWVLYVEVKDSKVVGIYIATVDSKADHPRGAPPDLFAPGTAPWYRVMNSPAAQ